ncbi:NADH-quinone oxidoreductase subunit A [uncultured bacterium]|nr:NADH-quinone oxidoreductase subunit A [uncultured bacterium]
MTEFGNIFAFIILALAFVGIGFFTSMLIRPKRPSAEKLTTYECGETPEGNSWIRFNIRFYVVALIFIIFDVEIVLLIPWLMAYQSLGIEAYIIGAVFMILLGLGIVYEWKKGDLEWARPSVKPLHFDSPKPEDTL